ncbi:MAG: hypothetical protein NZ108_07325 [Bacteroidia bacterium]|nr:hypothetical protein [Bacteroidia bacterium]
MGLLDWLFGNKNLNNNNNHTPTQTSHQNDANTQTVPTQSATPQTEPNTQTEPNSQKETMQAIQPVTEPKASPNPQPSTQQPQQQSHIPETKFVERNPPSQKPVYTIHRLIDSDSGHYVIGLELLYAIIEAEHEQLGYTDALTVNDIKFCDQYVELQKADLEVEILKALRLYEEQIISLQVDAKQFAALGFITQVDKIQNTIEVINKKIEKVEEIRKELRTAPDSLPMILSYRRGFLKGLMKLSQNKLEKRF